MKKRLRLSTEQQWDAIDRYTAGESPDSIADLFGVCTNSIRNALRKHGVEMRNRSAARTRISHREDAFDTITPESAYWLGFFCADGTIYKGKSGAPVIAIGLAARDREHLEKFRTFLDSKHAITSNQATMRGKTHDCVRFTIRSNRLAAALSANGMGTKSLNRIASPVLVESRDFWRGMVDGDGHIGVSNEKVRIDLCGGRKLMSQYLSFLRKNGIANNSNIRSQGKISRIDLSCATAVSAIKLLYENASIGLDRKLEAAHLILNNRVDEVRGLIQTVRTA